VKLHVAAGLALCLTGCVVRSTPPAPPPEAPPPAYEPPPPPPPPPPAPPSVLYGLEEALADAFSGPWQFIGAGPWHGNHRVHACAYRNGRVYVVNVFCTIKEPKAFRIEVYSPTRGRVRIYAEGRAPISTLTRRDYFTFSAESEPPPEPSSGLRPLPLGMFLPDLRAYDEARYKRFLPGCHAGVEIGRPHSGCLGPLAPHAGEWSAQNGRFLADPPEPWYRAVRELRALAARDADQQE
jgi:hypothetical protein